MSSGCQSGMVSSTCPAARKLCEVVHQLSPSSHASASWCRSLHGPQSGGFYACTLKGTATAEASRIKAFTLGVSSAMRNALRNLYHRESYYLRRYFAQSEDAVDFTTVVRHMRHLVSNALVLDTSASTDRASSPVPGDASSLPSQCGTCRPDHTASDGCCGHSCSVESSRLSSGARTVLQGGEASTSLGVAGCSHSQSEDSASVHRQTNVGASFVAGVDRQGQQVRGARHSACVSLDGGEIETAALFAESTNSTQPVRIHSVPDRGRQGTNTVEGTTKSSKLHPKAHMRRILQARPRSNAAMFCACSSLYRNAILGVYSRVQKQMSQQ